MPTLNPYLNFPGTTEEAFNFYKSVFGGEFIGGISRFSDMPDTNNIPEEDLDKVMHVALPIGTENVLMGSDALKSMGHKVTMGNNTYISIHPDSKEEADRIFNALSKDGEITMPLDDAFWSAYFGMLKDKFGILWMVNYDYNQQQ